MGHFRLDPVPLEEDTSESSWANGLTGEVLLQNASWFIRIRWIVIAVLLSLGLAGVLIEPEHLRSLGFRQPGSWPLYMGGLLTLLNVVAIVWVRQITPGTGWHGVTSNIWFQIATDLGILTGLVYLIGATNTVISFTYLFHITLACIFFGRLDSFLVTLLSAILFLATVVAQCTGLIPYTSVLLDNSQGATDVMSSITFAVPTVFVWLVMWYMVSFLSDAVRRRDRELESANQQLIKADEEINLQMLRVTHDLKAPFSGIESNIQVLKQLHWKEISGAVREIIGKIDTRSATLRARIGDILLLGGLRSAQAGAMVESPVNLHEFLGGVIQDVRGLAEARNVSVGLEGGDISVLSDSEQLKILFANLISNAITYSREGGDVAVRIGRDAGGVRVSITDHGIGISENAMPRIFEDFFRTQEAATFNSSSTGLGLAIVRQVASNLKLALEVDSQIDKGSVFRVIFPEQ